MINESQKLDEYEIISEKMGKLEIYFLDKIILKDIDEYDKQRFNDISSKFALTMFEYIKSKNINKDEMKSSINVEIEKIEDNIKNS